MIGFIQVVNQFSPGTPINVEVPVALCVPSSKTLLPGLPSLGSRGLAGLGLLLSALGLLALASVFLDG